ncbi:MAG: hypothetical protein IT430_09130 [Phycisphaerales bacterium]|nr:hypothetical protein [Phycisphaerales bacterium]
MNEPQEQSWVADDAFHKFRTIRPSFSSGQDANEATTRMRVIDQILFEVLGWDRARVDTETFARDVGFADYVFDHRASRALVLEAKREGTTFLVSGDQYPDRPVSFSLLASESKTAAAALRQAANYANSYGSRYVAITNGHQWVFGLTYVPGESIEDRRVFVFESLDAIERKFRVFFKCLSPIGLLYNAVIGQLFRSRTDPAPSKLSASIAGYPVVRTEAAIRNHLRVPLQLIWEEVNQNDSDQSFLQECYITPGKADGTLQLAQELIDQRKRTDAIVAEKAARASDVGDLLSAAKSPEKPIVVLGRIGHGKSIYLQYLRQVRAKESLEKYIQIDVDFLDRPETPEAVADYLYGEIERQLLENYGIDIYDDATVRGVLRLPTLRFRKSVEGTLAARQGQAQLEEAEAQFLANFVRDRQIYLKHVFHHLRSGQGHSVSVFFDNIDRRIDAIQEEAALRASAAARDWSALVFICLRPGTLQRSNLDGALDSIAPKIISIAPPKAAVMLRKRFDYAASLARGENQRIEVVRAALGKEVAWDLGSAAEVLECCADSVRRRAELGSMFTGIANGNNRVLIQYVRQMLISGNLNTQKILELWRSGGYTLREHEVARAIIFGDAIHYDPNDCKFLNLFDIETSDPREHFLLLVILEFMNRHYEGTQRHGYCTIEEIVGHACGSGYSAESVFAGLRQLFEREYCEGVRFESNWEAVGDRLRLRDRGRYHITSLVKSFVYLDAVVVDTPILDMDVRRRIRDVDTISERLERAAVFLRYLDESAKAVGTSDFMRVWPEIHSAIANDIEDIRPRLQSTVVS